MAIVYCSQKLSKVLGISKKQDSTRELTDISNSWNAQLFYLSKRKCIIFMNKLTLYSFIVLDFVKKDTQFFSKFFIEHYLQQLQSDNLLDSKYEEIIHKEYESIWLLPTDNDKKIIGSLNDCVYRIGVYETDKGGIKNLNSSFLGRNLNSTPLGSLNYKFPVELMKENIKNHT
jgi:hypothetical protein